MVRHHAGLWGGLCFKCCMWVTQDTCQPLAVPPSVLALLTHPEEGAPPSQLAWRGEAPSLKSMSPDEKRISICSILHIQTAADC
jgi:hypothetical protein